MKPFYKNLLLFAMGGGILPVNLSAETFTVEDLTDSSTIAIDRLHTARQDAYNEGDAPLMSSNQITLAKVPKSNNNTGAYYHDRVQLRGLSFPVIYGQTKWAAHNLNLNYTFMLLDDNDNVVTEGATHIGISARYLGSYYNYYNNGDDGNKGYSIVTGYWSDLSEAWDDPEYQGYNFRGCKEEFYKGKITRDADGDIHIDFTEPCVVIPINNSKYVNIYLGGYMVSSGTQYIIDNYHIDIIKPNAYLTGKVSESVNISTTSGTYGNPVEHEPYPIKIKFDGNSFEILNLTSNGYAITTENASPNRTRAAWIKGSFNALRGFASINSGQGVETHPQFNNSYGYRGNLNIMSICPVERSPRAIVPYSDIEGTYTESNGVAHRIIKNYWVTNGGQLRTYEKYISMTFPDFAYVYALDMVLDGSPVQNFYYSDAYVDNSIDIYDNDITHEIDHQLDKFGYSPIAQGSNENYIHARTTVTPMKNNQHVKRYELWIVPGQHSDATHTDFSHNNGHAKAYCLDGIDVIGSNSPAGIISSDSENPTKRSETEILDDGSVKFDVLMSEDDLPNASWSSKGEYSLFVKTIYNNHLEPTFHNLIAVTPSNMTAIEGVSVEKPEVATEYYDMMGRKVSTPAKGQIYIIRRGAKTAKEMM